MDKSEKPSSSHTHPSAGRDSVPALEVPLSNLQHQEDEMLSWLQYPLEDSFDKNYCSEDLYIEAPTSHSNFVHDAFSNLTLKEGERLHSIGLRPQTSLPSNLKTREREGAGNAHMASHTWEVAAGYDTNRGERVLAANTAMAIGAHRAAGLLFQSGAETFNRVRTNAQPHLAKRAQNAVTTQETGKSPSNLVPHTFKAGDEKYRFQPPVHRLRSPNFPLFSRAVGSLQQDRVGFGAQGKGRETASKGEQKAGVASPMIHAHPTRAMQESSSKASGALVSTKGLSVCFPPSSATRMTGMDSSRVPFQHETKLQESIAYSKDVVLTPRIDSTKTSSISCKLGAEAVSMTPVEEETSRASRTRCTIEGLPSFSATASAGLASGSLMGFSGAIETRGGLHLIPIKGKSCSGAKSTFTKDVESSMHSDLAYHDSERSQNIQVYGDAFPHRSELGAGEEFDSSSCPVITVERGDITMASPSGDSSEKSIKEAAAASMKRKEHPPEDIEIESKDFKDGKFSQGYASGAKRARAAEIHNLSERKRRNKINVKMKTLQDLIPNANKTDKASVLDEAIEYMKLLQSQVQLMSLRTGMAGLPMLVPPGMLSAPMQQMLRPPHLNLDPGAGLGFRMGMDVFGHPLSGSPYNASGLQLVSPQAGVQEAHSQLQNPRANEGYTLLPAQLQQQHLHSNMHTNADMVGPYTIQQEQKVSQLQSPARETSSNDVQ